MRVFLKKQPQVMWAGFLQGMEAGQCRGSGNEVSAGVTGSRGRDEGRREMVTSAIPQELVQLAWSVLSGPVGTRNWGTFSL